MGCEKGNEDENEMFQPGTQALMEIWKFQKSTELLIPKVALWRLVKEITQKEYSWFCIQAGAVLMLHEAQRHTSFNYLKTLICA